MANAQETDPLILMSHIRISMNLSHEALFRAMDQMLRDEIPPKTDKQISVELRRVYSRRRSRRRRRSHRCRYHGPLFIASRALRILHIDATKIRFPLRCLTLHRQHVRMKRRRKERSSAAVATLATAAQFLFE